MMIDGESSLLLSSGRALYTVRPIDAGPRTILASLAKGAGNARCLNFDAPSSRSALAFRPRHDAARSSAGMPVGRALWLAGRLCNGSVTALDFTEGGMHRGGRASVSASARFGAPPQQSLRKLRRPVRIPLRAL